MAEQEEINFGEVEAAEGSAMGGGKYLTPGMYRISFTGAEFGTSTVKQTPYMELSFISHSENPEFDKKEGRAKFYLTANTMKRVQYLHTAFIGKKLEKKFMTVKEIAEYFDVVFKSEAGQKLKKPCIVAGSISQDGSRLYSDLPYTGWVVSEDEFDEGAFVINGETFKKVITSDQKTYSPDSPNSDDDLLESKAPEAEATSSKAPWDN